MSLMVVLSMLLSLALLVAGAELLVRGASRLALRFGVLPLVIATGAGAGAQVAIGTSVLGGMLTATFLAIFFIPLFFVVIFRLFGRKKPPQPAEGGAP